jgi:hypothetical protein
MKQEPIVGVAPLATKLARYSKRKGRETEKRVLMEYRKIWPTAKRVGAGPGQSLKSGADLEGLPIHVQVKYRATMWICSEWRKAVRASNGALTHLVVADKYGKPLVVMSLKEWIENRRV